MTPISNKNFYKVTISAIGTVLILWVLFSYVDFKNVLEVLKYGNIYLIIFGVGILFILHLVTIARWQQILKVIGFNLPYKPLLYAYFANLPIAKLTPGYTGDFVRAFFLKKLVPARVNAGVILFEALIDVGVLSLASVIGALYFRLYWIAGIASFLLVSIALFFLVAPFLKFKAFRRWQDKISEIFFVINHARTQPLLFARTLLISFLMSLIMFSYVFVSFYSLGEGVPYLAIVAAWPLTVFVSLLPITLWGVGTRESAMIVLFAPYASSATIVAVGLIFSFIGAVVWPLLCLPFLFVVVKRLNKG